MQIGQSVASSLKWMMSARLTGQLITWVITIIVIRILTPQDYGLLAMASIILGILAVFEEIGLGSAIVQRKNLDADLVAQVFGLLIVLDSCLYGLLWLIAPWVGEFFNEPALPEIVRVMGLQICINAFTVIPDSMLSRAMNFRGKSVALFVSMLTGSFLTLVLAWQGLGVWALVFGNLGANTVRALVLQFFARAWYWPSFSFGGAKQAIHFGGFVTLDRLLWYFYSQSDMVIIGNLLGRQLLGFYSVGMHLASLPMQKIAGTMNEIGFSAFSKLQDDRALFQANLLKSVRLISIVAFPVFLGISSVAPEIVKIFLGPKWIGAILPIQTLSLVIPLRLLNTVVPTSLYAIGRADLSVTNSLIASTLLPLSFLVGVQWELPGVCIAWVIAYPLYFAIVQYRILPIFGVDISCYVRTVAPFVLISCSMYGLIWLTRAVLERFALPAPVVLFVLVSVGTAVYYSLITTFQGNTWNDLVRMFFSPALTSRITAWTPFGLSKLLLPAPIRRWLRERYRL